jgi:hypothetical protein
MEENFLKDLDHEEHEEHPDERWLVSYADMMTLLFGLFVMLYSMAMENQGKIDDVLKDVQITTAQQKPIEPTVPLIDPEQFAQLQKQVEEQTRELEILREMKSQADMNVQNLQNQVVEQSRTIASLPKEFIPDVREDLAQAQQKIQELERTIASIPRYEPPPPQPRDFKEDFEQSQARLKETKSEIKDLRKQLQAALEKTSKLLPPKKDNSAKLIAQIDDQKEQINQLKRDLQEQSRKLASTSSQAQQSQQQEEEIRRKEDELRRQQEELRKQEEENKKLQAKIKELETKTDDKGGSFLMFVVKWSTDKHDIDMTVTDPKGRKYDFKKRKFGSSPGEFTLDSRQGPGAEIWQADNFEPGIYTVTANLYQTYGNDKPAKLEASVVSSLRSLRLPASQLSQGDKVSWKIKIAENGEVTVL